MQPNLISQEEKKLLATVRERDRLLQATWDAPIIPLAEPFQRGWNRQFIIRDDITRRSDAHVFKQILPHINQVWFSRDRDNWDRYDAFGNLCPQLPQIIRNHVWNQLQFSSELAKWFSHGHFHHSQQIVEGWQFKFPYFFTFDIQPNIVTHTRTVLPDVESKISECDSIIRRLGGWERYCHLRGTKVNYRDLRDARLLSLANASDLDFLESLESFHEIQTN